MSARVMMAAAAVAAGCSAPSAVDAPPVAGVAEVARFDDARALAADGAGRLYVVDGGQIVVLDAAGTRLPGVRGGAGLQRLADVVDVDPTNGLEWFVADAAGGRVLRVSHDGRLLEDTPVPAGAPAAGLASVPDGPRGRPVAVAAGAGGVLYVAEQSRGVVLRWDDASRRRLRVVGGADAGAGALAAPVALAAARDGSLAVADEGRGVAAVFDAFGNHLLVTAVPGGARSVSWTHRSGAQALLVAGGRAVVLIPTGGGDVVVVEYDLGGEELVDAVETPSARWLLTPTRLLRVAR